MARRFSRSAAGAAAMSFPTDHTGRAGDNLSAECRRTLEATKDELRDLFGETAPGRTRHP